MMSLSFNQIMAVGVFLLGIGIFAFLGFATFNRLVAHLKQGHPEIWKSFQPSDSLAPAHDDKMAVVSFVVSRRYREAKDPIMTKMGDGLFWSAYVIAIDGVMIVAILTMGVFR